MDDRTQTRRWFWATLTLSSITVIGFVFAVFELLENRFFRDLNYVTLHYLYITRGMGVSLLLAFWAAWFVLRERKEKEERLRRSSERYRGILNCSPDAVVLYDGERRVLEWNVAAERLYGFAKEEVLGRPLPTIPPEQRPELEELMAQVMAGRAVLDLESKRRGHDEMSFEVQLSLLLYRDDSGQSQFLEVTHDIRERVRLRQTLLQLEKLTTMGKMAAGTAHHLNTPLASMLLRLRMMREGQFEDSLGADLERLERSTSFCQQFVQRLLDFSRFAQSEKQPEVLGKTVEAVVGFMSPQLMSKRIRLSLDLESANGEKVLGDRNQLEALFLILLSNALDAVEPGGQIRVGCRRLSEHIEVQVADNGCGMESNVVPHVFEPFFTTKPPGKGTGLGLAIASNILQDHGGTLHFDSAPHKGTTAYLELPIWQETTFPAGDSA